MGQWNNNLTNNTSLEIREHSDNNSQDVEWQQVETLE